MQTLLISFQRGSPPVESAHRRPNPCSEPRAIPSLEEPSHWIESELWITRVLSYYQICTFVKLVRIDFNKDGYETKCPVTTYHGYHR